MEQEQYQINPGSGSLFPTKQKRTEKSPDFYGDIVTPDGLKLSVSGWVKRAKSGIEYISLAVKEDDPVASPSGIMNTAKSAPIVPKEDDVQTAEVVEDGKDDDLPF